MKRMLGFCCCWADAGALAIETAATPASRPSHSFRDAFIAGGHRIGRQRSFHQAGLTSESLLAAQFKRCQSLPRWRPTSACSRRAWNLASDCTTSRLLKLYFNDMIRACGRCSAVPRVRLAIQILQRLERTDTRKALTSFKSLLKSAKHSHIAAEVTIKTNKRERRLEAGRDFPDAAELKRMVEATKPGTRPHALLLTMALTGLRSSELRGLRWKDVDLVHGELQVLQRADRFNAIGPPKSKAGFRTVPLAPELIEALKRWKLACPKAKARGDERLVFPTARGHIQDHKNMLRGMERLQKAAGVMDENGNAKYALHAFRHFFASWLINPKTRGGRELPPKVAQVLLGHSSIVMTLDVYGHMFPNGDDRAELAEATRALLDNPPSGNLADFAEARATQKAPRRAPRTR